MGARYGRLLARKWEREFEVGIILVRWDEIFSGNFEHGILDSFRHKIALLDKRTHFPRSFPFELSFSFCRFFWWGGLSSLAFSALGFSLSLEIL